MTSVVDSNSNNVVQSLQGALVGWSAFALSEKSLAIMQECVVQAKDAREESVAARKVLAENTKQLKRAVKTLEQQAETVTTSTSSDTHTHTNMSRAVEAVGKCSRTTVKSYQEEIDNLTRRCKTSEGVYAGLVQSLSELVDPAVALSAALEHVQALQQELVQTAKKAAASSTSSSTNNSINSSSTADRDELLQLRREVAEYEVEFRGLKNQDITIRKLESKIAELQTAGKQQLELQLQKAKQELVETEGRRVAEALEREAVLERKLQTLALELKAERAGREATQSHLLHQDEGSSRREAAWDAQKRILMDDAERLREGMHTITTERDALRLRVAALQGNNASSLSAPPSGGVAMADLLLERKAYEAEVAELTETGTHLREELRFKEEAFAEERKKYQTKIDAMERETHTLHSNLASLEAQISSAPSQALVESMKRELRILKRLEYNAMDGDAEHNERDPEIAGGNEEENDLESVLVAKLRRAESDLVTERRNRNELSDEKEVLQKALVEAEKAKEEADKLVLSLEKDLERAITSATTTTPVDGAAAASNSDRMIKIELAAIAEGSGKPSTLLSVLDPNAAAQQSLAEAETGPVASVMSTLSTTAASEKAQDDHSVATIVMAQRDRLRARCEALEAERDSFKRELQAQVQASESLKSDNTKLYEKVRYLQNYNRSAAPTSRGGGGGGAYHRSSSGAGGGERDLDLEALEQRYEASVDPFRQFSKAERQRKLNELSPMERTIFIVAKTFLATKEMRTALFVYVISMHLLVFITTYHWSHTGGCHTVDTDHLAHLPPEFPAMVQQQNMVKAAAAAADTAAGGG